MWEGGRGNEKKKKTARTNHVKPIHTRVYNMCAWIIYLIEKSFCAFSCSKDTCTK